MQDILLDVESNDMVIENGDMVVGFSDFQHQHLLLLLPKAAIKQHPLATVGIETFLNDSDIDGMLHEIRSKFIKDGMTVNKLVYNEQNGDLDYNAKYSY